MKLQAERRWPLQRRLVAVTLGVVTAVLLTTVTGFMMTLFGSPYADIDDRLRAAQEFVADRYPGSYTSAAEDTVFTDITLAIADPDGTTVRLLQRHSGSGPKVPSPVQAAEAIRSGDPVTVIGGETTWRLHATALPDGSWLVAGQPVNGLQRLHDNLVLAWIAAVAFLLVITALLTTHLVRYGLRPLTEIAGVARQIEAGDMSRRLPVNAKDEVGQVAAALNSMLGRIQHAFAQQQATEQRLRDFVHDAGHELRTPVTAIRGWSDLYRNGAVPPAEVPTAMRRIGDEALRMEALVEDLLLLASINDPSGNGSSGTAHRVVDLAEVARDAVLDAHAVEPGRLITTDLPAPGIALVNGDPTALHQVIANLLSNIRAHTPPGTRASVQVQRVSKPDGDHVVLRVTDDGPGVPDHLRDKVFDRFFRADPSRTHHSHTGAGLGLSIVAAIIASHGGNAETEPVQSGFSIRINMPAAVTNAAPPDSI